MLLRLLYSSFIGIGFVYVNRSGAPVIRVSEGFNVVYQQFIAMYDF